MAVTDLRQDPIRVAQLLRDRADSYWRDAAELDREGDSVMAIAYWAISAELRRLAGQLNGRDS